MFRSDGTYIGFGSRSLLRLLMAIRAWLTPVVMVDDRGYETRYRCENFDDASRPLQLWIKEAGTMRWLSDELRTDDVFLDIGANIGVYTLAAAHRLPSGRVIAVEPHKPNAVTLMRNVALNGFGNRVTVMTVALGDKDGAMPFHYSSFDSSSSGSHLGPRSGFDAVAVELVQSASVDRLIEDGTMPVPSVVKIDVDGNEPLILLGMKRLLLSGHKPRSIQVELNIDVQNDIVEFLVSCGYALSSRHLTAYGQKRMERGVPLEKIVHNAIFRPA